MAYLLLLLIFLCRCLVLDSGRLDGIATGAATAMRKGVTAIGSAKSCRRGASEQCSFRSKSKRAGAAWAVVPSTSSKVTSSAQELVSGTSEIRFE